tara:strand:- start:174 stop:356 length:183 start_codon:yes stop_codon:yes gene_type:complete
MKGKDVHGVVTEVLSEPVCKFEMYLIDVKYTKNHAERKTTLQSHSLEDAKKIKTGFEFLV